MKKLALSILIIVFILLNYHFFYVIIFENTNNFLWILRMYNNLGYKKINSIYNYSYNNSIQKYFNTYEKNKLHKDLVFPTFDRLYQKMEKCKEDNKITIVGTWLKETTLSKEDIFTEFIHNIIGLVVNWFNTIHNYLLELHNEKKPKFSKEDDINKYVLETFRYLCPVQFVSSKLKDPKHLGENNNNIGVIHDLKISTRENKFFGENTGNFDINRMDNYKTYMSTNLNNLNNTNNTNNRCPFYNSINNSKVPKNLSIYENKGYTVFGQGYRRCPGEHLSMIFLEEFIYFLDNKKINIFKRGEENLEHFIWDKIDKSKYILFLHNL